MKSNLNNKHDFITVSAIDSFKARINMTVNRYGCKVSARATVPDAYYQAVGDAFLEFDKACSKAKTNKGQQMAEVQTMVDNAADFPSLATSLAKAATVRTLVTEHLRG